MVDGISVIVPVYNVKDYLERCIDSIIMQTYQNYECILVDDGSMDGSGELCDELAAKYKQIKVIHQENGGLSAARNTGIRNAEGKYILFMDSDDFYTSENCFFGLIHRMCQTNADIVLFNYLRYTEEGKRRGNSEITFPNEPKNNPKAEILSQLVFSNAYQSSACVKFLKTDMLLENNLFFEEGRLSEDIEWSAKILALNPKIAICDEVFYAYTVRKGSISNSVGYKTVTDQLHVVKAMLKEYGVLKNDLLMNYIAFQYCALLINYQLCNDELDESVYSEIYELRKVLKFNQIKEVKIIFYCEKVLGFKMMTFLLAQYYRCIRRRK